MAYCFICKLFHIRTTNTRYCLLTIQCLLMQFNHEVVVNIEQFIQCSHMSISHESEQRWQKSLLLQYCDLNLWPFNLGGWGLVMDYPCAKFGDLNFSWFGFIVRTDRQTDRHTYRESYTDIAKCFTPATVVVVSNYNQQTFSCKTRACIRRLTNVCLHATLLGVEQILNGDGHIKQFGLKEPQ